MIENLLKNKIANERADIKATEIVKQFYLIGRYSGFYGVDIEVIDVKKIDCGLEILARAWKNGKQLGFGKDGKIDIERFRIFNPPILVDDENGSIIREGKDGKVERKLREDPVNAVIGSLAHTISLVSKEDTEIIFRSVGNTTSTFYPDANPETTSVDGLVGQSAAVDYTFTAIRDLTLGNTNGPSALSGNAATIEASTPTANNYYSMFRAFYLFDTSAILDNENVDSAIFSVYGKTQTNNFTTIDNAFHVCSSSPASNTDLVNGDYDQVGATSFGSFTYASYVIEGYNDITLNASGLANISKTGISKFGSRLGCDMNNIAPTWISAALCDFTVYFADTAGTTKDPKLVVVSSAVADGADGSFAKKKAAAASSVV